MNETEHVTDNKSFMNAPVRIQVFKSLRFGLLCNKDLLNLEYEAELLLATPTKHGLLPMQSRAMQNFNFLPQR